MTLTPLADMAAELLLGKYFHLHLCRHSKFDCKASTRILHLSHLFQIQNRRLSRTYLPLQLSEAFVNTGHNLQRQLASRSLVNFHAC